MLLACRFLMGIGGAMMWPAILGMTYGLLPRSKCGLAGGLILGAAGFGNAVGPLLGGLLTDTVGWRWIFFVNLPVAGAAILITMLVVPRDAVAGKIAAGSIMPEPPRSPPDLLALLLALDWALDLGWTAPLILGLFALSAIARGRLLAHRTPRRRKRSGSAQRHAEPWIPRRRNRHLAGLGHLLRRAALPAAVHVEEPRLHRRRLRRRPAAHDGDLHGHLIHRRTALSTARAPRSSSRLGALLLGGGMILLSAISAGTTYDQLVPGLVVLGVGVGLFYSSVTTAAITALDPSQASLAGAIVYMFQIAGGSIGVGFNTAIVVSASSMPRGIHIAFLVDGILAVGSAAVAILFVGGAVDFERLRDLRHHHRAHA